MRIKHLLLIAIVCSSFTTTLKAQKNDEMKKIKYRRSSLHTILMESENFPKKDTVIKAYNNAPFPDKYNNHTIGSKTFSPKDYPITDEERIAANTKKSLGTQIMNSFAAAATADIIDKNAADKPLIIKKYFEKNKIPNKIVAKWFNRREDGSFNMELIAERGFYNATEMEASVAEGTARGTASLADAGEELLKNTFVVVSRLNFVSNESVARVIRDIAKEQAKNISNDIGRKVAMLAAEKVYDKAKEGYSVWTTAYLYQLEWNDSIAAVFYNNLWMGKSNIDAVKKEAFDNSDLFKLNFIGTQSANSLVIFSLKENRTEEQIVKLATIRNIDAVYAKLQKEYDVFKCKTPLYTVDPLSAKIGMKEGLEGGEKFEILEQTINEKTGLTEYKCIGNIKVDKKNIWDNRYNAALNSEIENPELEATEFKGRSKNSYYPGLLIRQLK
jgi:hypothetical protein